MVEDLESRRGGWRRNWCGRILYEVEEDGVGEDLLESGTRVREVRLRRVMEEDRKEFWKGIRILYIFFCNNKGKWKVKGLVGTSRKLEK